MRGKITKFLASGSCEKEARQGFTMIEFTLASAFVALLLITISGVILNMTSIYRKGVTLKTVNSVGRSVVDEIEDAISGGGTTIVQEKEAAGSVVVGEDDETGALCAGKYTFIWNTREAFRGDDADPADVTWNGGNVEDFNLVKVADSERLICTKWDEVKSGANVNLSSLGDDLKVDNGEDLLSNSDIRMYVYSVEVTTVQTDTVGAQAFIAGTIQLGSDREEALLSGESETGYSCEGATEENEYCALNEFKFAARTAGKGV